MYFTNMCLPLHWRCWRYSRQIQIPRPTCTNKQTK